MNIKEFAYSTQRLLEARTRLPFKRGHVYELLAAAAGYCSLAALHADAVFIQHPLLSARMAHPGLVRHRCVALGYPADMSLVVSMVLHSQLADREIGVIRFDELIACIGEGSLSLHRESEVEESRDEDESDQWLERDELGTPFLLDALEAAASKHNATAHYVLALLQDPVDEYRNEDEGNDYWYNQERSGHILTGVNKEWADTHARYLERCRDFERHLRMAAKLGCQRALLDLADRFDDPAFFEKTPLPEGVDPSWAAEVALRMGRHDDVVTWLKVAAKSGDVAAMRQLIEEHDQGDPLECWTWFYLAELLGTDLARDEYFAIDEHGSLYDDDAGGPMYVDGRGGVKLKPIDAHEDAAARHNAQEIFANIKKDI